MRTIPAFLDIEASGFGRSSYPIEVGFVLGDGSSYCTLIYPAEHWTHWDASAELVHGIARENLLQHGRRVLEVAQNLNARLRGLTLYSDAWGHDYAWLGTLYEEANLSPSFKLESLRSLLTETEANHWHAAQQLVIAELTERRHRASADARMLQQTLKRVRGL